MQFLRAIYAVGTAALQHISDILSLALYCSNKNSMMHEIHLTHDFDCIVLSIVYNVDIGSDQCVIYINMRFISGILIYFSFNNGKLYI